MEEKEANDPWWKTITNDPLLASALGFVVGMLISTIMFVGTRGLDPREGSYSLALTAVGGIVGGCPLLSPSFELALNVGNTRRLLGETCFKHAEVALSYEGVAVGEARVPGWCVAARSTAEVEAVARGRDVRLPDGLRKRLEAELRWGSAQLDVEARLFRDDELRGPVLLWCKAVGPQLPPQPLQCKAFVPV